LAKYSLIIVAFLVLSNCTTPPPPYAEPEGQGAFLQNRFEARGQARFKYYFQYAGSEDLSPRGVDSTDAIYKIPPGKTVVGVRVIYTPAYGRNMFARANDRYYHIFVRNFGFTGNKSMTEEERASFSGLKGLRFDALEGHTYQINCRIENGRAQVWIEELDGTTVSETVFGFADADYVVRGQLGASWEGAAAPNPASGWKVLDDLPDPID